MLGLGEREPRVKKNTLRRDRLTWTIRRARKHGRDRGGVQVPLICGNPVRQFRRARRRGWMPGARREG